MEQEPPAFPKARKSRRSPRFPKRRCEKLFRRRRRIFLQEARKLNKSRKIFFSRLFFQENSRGKKAKTCSRKCAETKRARTCSSAKSINSFRAESATESARCC